MLDLIPFNENPRSEYASIGILTNKYKASEETVQQVTHNVTNELDNMMANFVHDIRTPSNTLYGFLELLEETIGDSRLKSYIINAKKSAIFINELTTNILDKLTADKERESSKIKEVETIEFFSGIAEMFSSNMYKKKIHYLVHIDPKIPKLMKFDVVKLKRILMNLLGNAYKFTPKNSRVMLDILYLKEEDIIHFSIKDTGIGIAEDKQKKIFKAFSQAQDSTALEYGGTGLGLSICADYIGSMGGELKIKSEVDIGTEFYFDLKLEILNTSPTYRPLENSDAIIAIVADIEHTLYTKNILRNLKSMGVDTAKILTTSSHMSVPKNVSQIIIFQSKIDTKISFKNYEKVLIIEDKLFALHQKEFNAKSKILFKGGYLGKGLYDFTNTQERPKILIVDDNRISVALLEKILEYAHCDIDLADNGKVALDMLINAHAEKKPYKIAYIDNFMPILSGVEMMQKFRSFEKDNELEPLYAVSISGEKLDKNSEKVNFDIHLGKQFHLKDILHTLTNNGITHSN